MAQIPPQFQQLLFKSVPPARVLAVALGVGSVYLASSSLYTVTPGHRAILYSRLAGILPTPKSEGTHILLPFIERPIIFDIRAKPTVIASLSGTKDLQMVNMQMRVLARPDVAKLATVYTQLGLDWEERVLPSIVNEVLKSVVAQFNASQLITQREKVSRLVRDALQERASIFNIVLDDVSLTHVKFSPDFTSAVEAKQIAQQDAQRAAYVVDKAHQEKQSIIVRAQGEAQSAELIGNAVKKDPGFLTLKRLEAAREVASLIRKGSNKVYLTSGTLMLNVNENMGDVSKPHQN